LIIKKSEVRPKTSKNVPTDGLKFLSEVRADLS